MSIKPGTLCLIVGYFEHPEYLGRQCETVTQLQMLYSISASGQSGVMTGYVVRIPGTTSPTHGDDKWAVAPQHLMPIMPPGEPIDMMKPEEVTA